MCGVIVAGAVGATLPGSSTVRVSMQLGLLGFVAAVAAWLFVRRDVVGPWRLVGIGALAFVASDAAMLGGLASDDSAGTLVLALRLAASLCMVGAVLRLMRRHDGTWDRVAMLDSLVVTAALLTVSWDRVVNARFAAPPATWRGAIAFTAPVLAIATCAVGAAASFVSSRRRPAVALLAVALSAIGLGGLIVGDQTTLNRGVDAFHIGIDAVLLLVLMSSVRDRRDEAVSDASEVSRVRTLSILVFATASSAVSLLQSSSRGGGHLYVPQACIVLMFALVSVRAWSFASRARDGAIRQGTRRLASLMQGLNEAVFIVDHAGHLTYSTPSAATLLAIDADHLVGARFADCFAASEARRVVDHLDAAASLPAGEAQDFVGAFHDATQHERFFEMTLVNLRDDPDVEGIVVTMRDATARRRVTLELERRAFHDELTNLANRALFLDRLDHARQRSARLRGQTGVLMLDLDNFKDVNDALGHAAGDQLLRAVADRLRTCLRPSDTIARLGGDEFAILLEDIDDATDAVSAAQRVLEVMQLPVPVGDLVLAVPMSIGVATAQSGVGHGSLLKDADTALYEAKRNGKNNFVVFDASMGWNAYSKLRLRSELEAGIARDELRLVFQPIVKLGSLTVAGLEALVRWEHPKWGTMLPADFVPLAEESSLIVALGEWVLRRACEFAREWNAINDEFYVSVNLSARQLRDPDFPGAVADVIRTSGLPPQRIMLELTETALIDDQARENLTARIAPLGVRIAIDDFGTGYSSLSYLQSLPVDVIKVDRGFVSRLDEVGMEAVVRSVSAISTVMGFSSIAEGVENADVAAQVASLDYGYAQGYLYSRPLDPDAVPAILRADRLWPAAGLAVSTAEPARCTPPNS